MLPLGITKTTAGAWQAVFFRYDDAIVPLIMATPSQSRLPLDILACAKAVTACQWLQQVDTSRTWYS